jgi:hypothetical protein
MGTYYRNIENFVNRIDSGIWVEIGVDRGEGSTKFFADLAKDHATRFYAVDYDQEQIDALIQRFVELPDHVKAVQSSGEDFLDNFRNLEPDARVSLVYLDNFDWDYWVNRKAKAWLPLQKERYLQKMGVEMTNLNSQQAHLKQAIRLMPYMSNNSIIVCDDTWFEPDEGVFLGKCSAAIPYLLSCGYEILHSDGYRNNSGAILGKFDQSSVDSVVNVC